MVQRAAADLARASCVGMPSGGGSALKEFAFFGTANIKGDRGGNAQ